MRFFKKFLLLFVALVASSLVAGFVVKKKIPAFGDEDDDSFSVVACMSGVVFEGQSQDLMDARATAFMGGVELDLMDADLAPGAFLTLRAVMGGIDVVVPSNWRVEVMGRGVMGGIGNLTDPDSGDGDGPVLLVDALAVMGGIEIHQAEIN